MRTINAEQLRHRLEKSDEIPVINVLDPEQFRKEHVPGSANVPLSDSRFVERVEQIVGDKNSEVIVYCASRECDASEKAGAKLEEAGFTNVHDFEGGMKEWKGSGMTVA